MNDISANTPCNQAELEKWLDETSAPLSDDEMVAMSAYFDSESFPYTESDLCVDIDKQNIIKA